MLFQPFFCSSSLSALILFLLTSPSLSPILDADLYSTLVLPPPGNQNSTSSMNCGWTDREKEKNGGNGRMSPREEGVRTRSIRGD